MTMKNSADALLTGKIEKKKATCGLVPSSNRRAQKTIRDFEVIKVPFICAVMPALCSVPA
jgi:hypothetical protein